MLASKALDERSGRVLCFPCKPRDESSKANRQRKSNEMPSAKKCPAQRNAQKNERGPDGRLLVDGKINDNSASECDGHPRDKTSCADLDRSPVANANAGRPHELGKAIEPLRPRADRRP
jgi:hypothetical protein